VEKVKALNQSGFTWPVSDWLIAQLQRWQLNMLNFHRIAKNWQLRSVVTSQRSTLSLENAFKMAVLTVVWQPHMISEVATQVFFLVSCA